MVKIYQESRLVRTFASDLLGGPIAQMPIKRESVYMMEQDPVISLVVTKLKERMKTCLNLKLRKTYARKKIALCADFEDVEDRTRKILDEANLTKEQLDAKLSEHEEKASVLSMLTFQRGTESHFFLSEERLQNWLTVQDLDEILKEAKSIQGTDEMEAEEKNEQTLLQLRDTLSKLPDISRNKKTAGDLEVLRETGSPGYSVSDNDTGATHGTSS